MQPPSSSQSSANQVLYDGLRVSLTPSPVGKRIIAYCVDMGLIISIIYPLFFAIIIGAMVVFSGIAAFHEKLEAGDGATGIAALVFTLFFFFFLFALLAIQDVYFIWFERKSGATPGKKLFGLKVVSLDGSPVTFSQAVIRDLMRYIDCILIFPGLFSILLNERRRRLGDYLAGTAVVHSESREKSEKSMYMSREEYEALLESLRPQEVEPSIAREYLRFAFPAFVMRTGSMNEEERRYWEEKFSALLPGGVPSSIDRQRMLRFFAEHCFHQVQ